VSAVPPTRTEAPELLRLDQIRVDYGGLHAVRGVDLSIRTGECVAILGPNGAGKTSLINTIAGNVTPSGGDVLFRGESLRSLRTEQRVAKGIVMVPEGRRLFASLTVKENLELAKASNRNRQFAESMGRILTIFPALAQRLNQRAATLSGGEQQMLAIGRALLTAPDLLILDEPSTGLAPKIIHEVYKQLAAVVEQGITILLVEQNMSALDLAHFIHVLTNGKIVSSGPVETYRNSNLLAEAYLGLGA
jgi:branched-chain amino acid transport system ATP-binding protein